MQSSDAFLYSETNAAVTEWWQMACACFGPLYLYYRPSVGASAGSLRIVAEEHAPPAGFELAHSSRLSPAWDREQAKAWIYQTARRLPILPTEGAV